jgi:uncharacterized repeat protein (TIGR01451 family)
MTQQRYSWRTIKTTEVDGSSMWAVAGSRISYWRNAAAVVLLLVALGIVRAEAAADLALNKSSAGAAVAPGDTVTYLLTYANAGPDDGTGVIINEVVPANTTFNQAASAPTVWSCADGSPAGTACSTVIGAVPGNNIADTVNFAVTIDDPLPAGVTQISNIATISDDGTHGADPTPANNSSTDTTPVTVPVPVAVAVPTLSTWALVALALLLAVCGLHLSRKQHA